MWLCWHPVVVATFGILILVPLISGQVQDENYVSHKCSVDTYTVNSAYQQNLNTTFKSLYDNNDLNYGFYNLSEGEDTDRVNTIALCRGDIGHSACLNCLRFSTLNLPKRCPFQNEAIVWYDNCMLRYSNRGIFHSVEPHHFCLPNPNNATEANWFSQVVGGLLSILQQEASRGNSRKKFAARDTNIGIVKRTTIHGLVQCTPDLTELQCSNCLNETFNEMASDVNDCPSEKQGGRVGGPSCNFRYELYSFYENSLPPSSQTPPTEKYLFPPAPPPTERNVVPPPQAGRPVTHPKDGGNRRTVAIVVSTLSFVALVTCSFIIILLKRRKARLRSQGHQIFLLTDAHDIRSTESLQFDFETIQVATDNFNKNNLLGQGGFGSVYKGKLAEGKEIAVKRLATQSRQGDVEFRNEVILLAKLQHRNLVRLLGYCLERNERILIYEFMPNSSLDQFLFDPVKCVHLDWEARYKIITGIAKGLLYLHEDSRLRVIHRDLKSGNILLDEEMCPKIADFGMARLFELNQTHGDTTRLVGTYGYMAPEYVNHGKFTVKSDVYSFGILILEIISGQKNSRFCIEDKPEELNSFAWESWKAGTTAKFIDPMIQKSHKKEIVRSIHIGLLCIQERASARPTMASVVLMLSRESLVLPFPSTPAYLTSSGGNNSSIVPSINQVSISDMLPR